MIESIDTRLRLHSSASPDKTAVISLESPPHLSYLELDKAVDSCVEWLISIGIVSRDILALVADNSAATLIIYLACLRAKIIVNPYPTTIEPIELTKYLELFDVQHLVFPDNSKFRSILDDLPKSHSYPSDTFIENLVDGKHTARTFFAPTDSPACMYYSSGTTGSPKGILYSYKNMTALAQGIVHGFRFSPKDRHLVILPMGHTAAINYSLLPSIWLGNTLVLAPSFWAIREQFWELISAHNISYVQTVPTTLFALVHMPPPQKKPVTLEWIGCGSAPLPLTVQKTFQRLTGIPVGNLYGLSESGPSHIDHPLQPGWVPGSIGFPLSCNSSQIIDEHGSPLPDGVRGEIALSGPNIFVGYHKNPSAYREAVRESYFRTGDIGYRDKTGRFFFQDRKKDLIIQGGVNIFPGEVEEVLMEIPWIKEAAVIGTPDPILGERVAAYIVASENGRSDHEAVLRHCRDRLSQHKLPHDIVFLDDLPKGPSGKILKRALRETSINKKIT